MSALDITSRAARHGALADPVRLAIVDELTCSDRSPVELRRLVGIESNLLAHHLDVLENAGMIERSRSGGDGRRCYVHLRSGALMGLVPRPAVHGDEALFVCTRNSARSQLAAALWTSLTGSPAESAGTHPADQVHPGAVSAAHRAGLQIADRVPRTLATVGRLAPLVVTVCDQAHEELAPPSEWLHWSIPDPVEAGSDVAFDSTVTELRSRIAGLLAGEEPTP